jgi:hypothetical protein
METFINWPEDFSVPPVLLVTCGFEHYDYPCIVRCRFCKVPIDIKRAAIHPFLLHISTHNSDSCFFLNNLLTTEMRQAMKKIFFSGPRPLLPYTGEDLPTFETYEKRLNSFDNFKLGKLYGRGHHYAIRGLYYSGVSDIIKCCKCKKYRKHFNSEEVWPTGYGHDVDCPNGAF